MSDRLPRLKMNALALTLALLASPAAASDSDRMIVVVPEANYPDVVVIGNGWPSSMTNGCLDRHECAAPTPGAKVKPQAPPAAGSLLSDIPASPSGGKGPPPR